MFSPKEDISAEEVVNSRAVCRENERHPRRKKVLEMKEGNVRAPVSGFLLADPTSCGVYRQVVSQCTME